MMPTSDPAQTWAQHFAEMREWLDPAVAEAADPAAAEARGYRKAITAAALSEAVGWLETYLEAIAEEGK